MFKIEQLSCTNQLKRLVPSAPAVLPSSRTPMFQTTSNVISQRLIDPHAIDISSIKGQFAWEHISIGDTYMPVIFRYVNIVLIHSLFF
jgi:hypothetical protein